MRFQLKENLIFINKNDDKDKFKLIKWHYYCQDEEIWCARFEDSIYPLGEICLSYYSPIVNDEVVNDCELYEQR